MKLEDRSIGSFVGGVIGDAFGMPTEGIGPAGLLENYGGCVCDFVDPVAPHPNGHLKAGQYTDDGQQMIALAETLINCKRFDIHDFGKRIAVWGKRNLTEPGYERFPGATSMSAAYSLEQGISPFKSGSTSTTSCGSAMRAGPIGIYFHKNIDDVTKYAHLSSVPTHNTQACKEGAAVVALTVAHLLRDENPLAAVRKVIETVNHPELRKQCEMAYELREAQPKLVADKIGTSASVLDTVPFALYSFLHSPNDFLQVMITAANAVPGDTDSFGCIAGKFAGAHLGLSAIPERLQTRLEDGLKIRELALQLYKSAERFG